MQIHHVTTIRTTALEQYLERTTRTAQREQRTAKARRYASSFRAMLKGKVSK